MLRNALGEGTFSMQGTSNDARVAASIADKLALRALRSDDAIVVGNRAGIVEWANAAWTRITGHGLDETVHKPVTHFLDQADIDRSVLDFVQAHFVAGKRCVVELPFEAAEGGPRWIHLEVDPYRDAMGEVSEFVAVATDITERREAELALDRHLNTAVDDPRAERSAGGDRLTPACTDPAHVPALSTLALDAAWAGRELLPLCDRIVALASDPAADAGSEQQGAGAHGRELAALSEAARELAIRLIERAEQAGPAPCTLDVSALVAACCAALEQDLPRTVRLDAVLEMDLPAVRSVAGPLCEMLADLLRSGAESIADGWGTLSVTTGCTKPGHALRSPVYRSSFAGTLDDRAPRAFIEIHDTGLAFTPEETERLRGGALPAPPQGRVFALLRARALAAELDAELHVCSSLGGGTQILLLLPAAEPIRA